MASTAVFAEILVVGFQAAAWLTLLVLGLFGTDWVTLSGLESWVALVTVVAVATAYMLGVMLDRIADDIWLRGYQFAERQGWREGGRLTASSGSTEDEPVRRMRFAVMDASEGLGKFLDYQRSRLRVARATAVNATLSTPAAVIFLSTQAEPSGGLIAFLTSAAVALILASVYTAIAINGAWEGSLRNAYEIVNARTAGSTEEVSPAETNP